MEQIEHPPEHRKEIGDQAKEKQADQSVEITFTGGRLWVDARYQAAYDQLSRILKDHVKCALQKKDGKTYVTLVDAKTNQLLHSQEYVLGYEKDFLEHIEKQTVFRYPGITGKLFARRLWQARSLPVGGELSIAEGLSIKRETDAAWRLAIQDDIWSYGGAKPSFYPISLALSRIGSDAKGGVAIFPNTKEEQPVLISYEDKKIQLLWRNEAFIFSRREQTGEQR